MGEDHFVEWSKVLHLVTQGAVSSSSVIPGSMLCRPQQPSVFWARKTLSNSIARFLAEVAKGAHLGPGDALCMDGCFPKITLITPAVSVSFYFYQM